MSESAASLLAGSGGERAGAGYLRTLVPLLLVGSLFEGYDGAILDVLAPDVMQTYGLGERTFGMLGAAVRAGALLALVAGAAADRIGRRPVLLASVLGYTVLTVATAFAPNAVVFAALQCGAQAFLAAEYGVAVTILAEELPPQSRAAGLGWFTMCSAAGVILVPLLVAATPLIEGSLGWRAAYLVGVVPLVSTAVGRRRLRETSSFLASRARRRAAGDAMTGAFAPWRGPYRGRLVAVGTTALLRNLALSGATSWWMYYAQREAGVPKETTAALLVTAYGLGLGGYALSSMLMERIGRRGTVLLFGIAAWLATTALFESSGVVRQGVGIFLAVFFGLGAEPVMQAFYTELFPTEVRARAAAWARNAFEIPGIVLGPLLVGFLGDHQSGPLRSIGNAAATLAVLLPASAIVAWRWLPETRGTSLEMAS